MIKGKIMSRNNRISTAWEISQASLACPGFGLIIEPAHRLVHEFGGIAQLVERVVRNDEAWGSNPHTSSPKVFGAAAP